LRNKKAKVKFFFFLFSRSHTKFEDSTLFAFFFEPLNLFNSFFIPTASSLYNTTLLLTSMLFNAAFRVSMKRRLCIVSSDAPEDCFEEGKTNLWGLNEACERGGFDRCC
jgi:hypothetical protein